MSKSQSEDAQQAAEELDPGSTTTVGDSLALSADLAAEPGAPAGQEEAVRPSAAKTKQMPITAPAAPAEPPTTDDVEAEPDSEDQRRNHELVAKLEEKLASVGPVLTLLHREAADLLRVNGKNPGFLYALNQLLVALEELESTESMWQKVDDETTSRELRNQLETKLGPEVRVKDFADLVSKLSKIFVEGQVVFDFKEDKLGTDQKKGNEELLRIRVVFEERNTAQLPINITARVEDGTPILSFFEFSPLQGAVRCNEPTVEPATNPPATRRSTTPPPPVAASQPAPAEADMSRPTEPGLSAALVQPPAQAAPAENPIALATALRDNLRRYLQPIEIKTMEGLFTAMNHAYTWNKQYSNLPFQALTFHEPIRAAGINPEAVIASYRVEGGRFACVYITLKDGIPTINLCTDVR